MKSSRNRYKEYPKLQYALKFLCDLVIVICVGIVFVEMVLGRTAVSGNSMNPCLANDDQVLVNHFAYTVGKPSRYDVVAFTLTGMESSKVYIKRVIGLPGETVLIKNGKIYIDGELLEDDVSQENIITAGLASKEIKLGEDEYFVLGDNRNNSEDSRFANIGNVKLDNIIGKPWLVVQPFDSFGFVS